MPGRNPREAVLSFLEPLKEAVAVLDGYAKFMVGPCGGFRKDTPYTWILNGEEGMSLSGGAAVIGVGQPPRPAGRRPG